ncbi:MAG: ABC transporter permease [Candidatus Rokubacteria bacterium]|nr:ABC transporter permease [Candidatus Rokubacteria bacterium]
MSVLGSPDKTGDYVSPTTGHGARPPVDNEYREAELDGSARKRRTSGTTIAERLSAVSTFAFPFVVLVAIWALVAAAGLYPNYIFPSPVEVGRTVIRTLGDGSLLRHVAASLFRLGLGFAAGCAIGFPLAVLIGINRTASRFFVPLITFFNSIPGLAWIPLAILWFGIDYKAVTFIIFNSVFFPVAFSTVAGIRGVPQSLINAALCLGAGHKVLIQEVYIPGALPSIVTGMRLGVGYGWRALIGGEMIATSSGLGFMIFDARQTLESDVVVLGMVAMGALYLTMDRLVLRPLEARTIERWGTVRSD